MKGVHLSVLAICVACVFTMRALGDDATAPPSTQPGQKLINIQMQQAMPEDIFSELSKQSGVHFSNGGNLWDQDAMQNPVDVNIANQSFWQALRQVCQLTGVSVQPNWGFGQNAGKRIQIDHFQGNRQNDWTAYPTADGPGVMVQVQSFNRQQSINYGGQSQPSQNYCALQCFVYVDPSLAVQSVNQNLKADLAVDDAGNSMLPGKSNNMFFGGMQQRSLVYQCQVPLKYPDHPGKKIADVKFSISMRVGSRMDSLSIEKPLQAAESSKQFGETEIDFQSAKKTANGYEVKVSVSQDQNGGNPWGLLQTAQLLDEKGRAFQYSGGGGGGGGDNGMAEFTMNYMTNGGNGDSSPAGPPAKWIIEMPADTRTVKVPVEFKDLALP